jgi:catechol 2,3-dioxygenase-like lactoylglutathione lyase family enzyme
VAVSNTDAPQLRRLLRFSLTTGNIGRLAVFYQQAFDCRTLGAQHMSGADFQALMGVTGGAQRMTLQLGYELLELLQFDRPGQPYAQPSASSDLWFQHFAIVVTDMDRAFARLSRVKGWTAISSAGPERLPAESGGVSAFKFRDPDGHPLELLAFAPGKVPSAWQPTRAGALYLGIDHSAISVADSARSIGFYEALGLRPDGQSLNQGAEQARLDGLPAPQLEVSALALSEGVAHLELLCYRGIARGEPVALRNNDIAATRLIFETAQPLPGIAGASAHRGLVDPDGHHLQLVSPEVAPAQNG